MEFTLPLPQQLERNSILLKQWTHFSHRFHCHRNSVSSSALAVETPSVLLFAANQHLKSVCDSLKLYDFDLVKLGKVLEVIEDICLPSFLLLFERFRYFTLEQDSSETLHDFINVMRKQVELCEFGDTKDSIMASTLANGLNDDSFRHTLQTNDGLCFEDAVIMCKNLPEKSALLSNHVTSVVPASSVTPMLLEKPKEMKKNFKAASTSNLKETMYILPFNSSLKDEDDFDDSDNMIIKTVVNTSGRKRPVKLKKKSGQWPALQNDSTSKNFLCFRCDNEYASRKSFRRHVAIKHPDCNEYFCKHCRKTFYNRTECITHCMGHNTSPSSGGQAVDSKGVDNTEFLCWYCDEMLPNLTDYKKHCSSHSAVRVFYCDLCQRKNHTLIRMIGHLKGHLSPRHRCEICANCFGRAELLDAHMQTHVAQPVHQCQICFKNFVSADRLQGHMRTHSGEKRFTCELCGKSFCQKMSLDYHKRVHSGEKPYECDVCGKKTASFGYLRKHKQMHSDKRPYVCEVCGKSFRFHSNLTRHCNGHTGKRAFACDVCGRTFIYREGLRDHIKAGRCPGRRQDGIVKRSSRASRSRSHHTSNSLVGSGQGLVSYSTSHHTPETLLNELPHWQYMLRHESDGADGRQYMMRHESDGADGMIVVPPYY